MHQLGVAIVFGAYGGIGAAVAGELLRKGVTVVGVGRNEEKLLALQKLLPGILVRILDGTDTEGVEQLFAEVRDNYSAPTYVVNCIGSVLLKPAHLTSAADFSAVIATNLLTSFNIVRAAGKTMNGGGSVVLVSSCAAKIGLPNHEAISAAKAGIEGLARSAAATYASRKLRFNVVAPGLTRTPMTARMTSSPQAEAASLALHPLKRLGEVGDISRVIMFLLELDNDWITGQVIGVDGGLASLKV